MRKIALTGNIGSGKSVVSMVFRQLGIPVFDADSEAHKAYDDPQMQKAISELFGDEVLDTNGRIDRKVLGSKVFNDKLNLDRLTSLIHPWVMDRFYAWTDEQHTASPLVIMESAILFEYGLTGLFDQVVLVTSPQSLRMKRVMDRDGISSDAVMQRISNQWPEDWKIDLADAVLVNDEQQLLLPQVVKLIASWGI